MAQQLGSAALRPLRWSVISESFYGSYSSTVPKADPGQLSMPPITHIFPPTTPVRSPSLPAGMSGAVVLVSVAGS
jgi:hypothetical protein